MDAVAIRAVAYVCCDCESSWVCAMAVRELVWYCDYKSSSVRAVAVR